MLIDLLAGNNYLNINLPMIRILGLHRSIYISYILNEYQKNNVNNTLISEYFELDRSVVESVLTFKIEEQKILEEQLSDIGVITRDEITKDADKFRIKLNLNVLYSLFATNDELTLVDIKKITKEKTTKGGRGISQRQRRCNDLKYNLTAPNKELLDAYQGWVDGVYENPKGFLSTTSIKVFQKTVDDFAKGDLDLALKIIEIATVNGYRDATWAINVFNRDYATSFNRQYERQNKAPSRAQLGDEVF